MKLASAVLVIAACGTRADQPQSASPQLPVRLAPPEMPKPDPIVKGVPHGGDITHVAVTEQGDAALTSDMLNSVRLWPALDGTRQPVPLGFASEVKQLAITHAGRDLVAVILDRGGAITVMRLGLDGSSRGRVQIGHDDVSFDEVAVSGETIIARTSGHVIEAYAIAGSGSVGPALLGRLEPPPGQRVTDLAARSSSEAGPLSKARVGRIAAIVQDTSDAYLRWISIGRAMSWEPPIKLPEVPRDDMFALSPTSKRIAFVGASNAFYVIDLDWVPKPVVGDQQLSPNASHRAIGFIDNDTIAVVGFSALWWRAAKPPDPAQDPWAVPEGSESMHASLASVAVTASFADGLLVGTNNGSLVLAQPNQVRYLGWRTPAHGGFHGIGSHLVLAQSGSRFTWLDDDLQALRSIDLHASKPSGSSWAYGIPLGAHHAFSQSHFGDDTSTIELVDVDDPTKRHAIVENKKGIEQYFPADDTVGVKVRNKLRRYKLDLATTSSVEMLPAITINDYSLMFVRVFDPDTAGGLAAVTLSWPKEWSEYQALTYYRVEKGRIVARRIDKWEGQILRAKPDGELLALVRGAESKLVFMKNHETVREVKLDKLVPPLAINLEGTRIAIRGEPSELVVFDDHGSELWRRTIWGVSNQMFTPSGARLIVNAPGGVVALDAATGDVVAKECGFEFGVHDKPPEFATHGFASVCEDPIVQ